MKDFNKIKKQRVYNSKEQISKNQNIKNKLNSLEEKHTVKQEVTLSPKFKTTICNYSEENKSSILNIIAEDIENAFPLIVCETELSHLDRFKAVRVEDDPAPSDFISPDNTISSSNNENDVEVNILC